MNSKIAAALACLALQACAAAGGPAPDPASIPVPVGSPALALVPVAELRALTEAAPWWCFDWDEASRTCESVARTTWHDGRSGMSQIAYVLSATPRIMIIVSMPSRFESDTICGRPAEMSVNVEVAADSALPDDSAEQIEAAMLDVLAKRGESVLCIGAMRESGLFRLTSYSGAGEMVEEDHTFRLLAERPALRVPDREI